MAYIVLEVLVLLSVLLAASLGNFLLDVEALELVTDAEEVGGVALAVGKALEDDGLLD